jgi:hypothetical protein
VAFSPTVPQYDAGIRIDPPVSLPIAMKTMSAATAAPDPPLEPPGIRSVLQGFRTGPKWGLADVIPYASSCMLSFPTLTAPASSNLRTTVAS